MRLIPQRPDSALLEQIIGGYQCSEKATGDENPCQVSHDLALKVYDILTDIAQRTEAGELKHEGTSIAVGYTPAHDSYVLEMHADHFEDRDCSMDDPDIVDDIVAASLIDGGITVDSAGNILVGGVQFTANAKQVLEEMGIPNHRKSSERFGFSSYVGTRHTSAIANSYMMPNALFFVLSEETNDVRIFRRGQIIYSPHKEEIIHPPEADSSNYELPPSLPADTGTGLEQVA